MEHRGPDHTYSREAARLLIDVLERQGRSAEADKVRAEVPLRPDPTTPPAPDR
jgi:hypothetical protein